MNPEQVFCKAPTLIPTLFLQHALHWNLSQVLTMLMVSIMGDDLTALSLALSIAVWKKTKQQNHV